MLPPFDPWQSLHIAGDVVAATQAGPDGLAARQSARLQALLDAAVQGSALYRDRLGPHPSVDDWARLPPVAKTDLMAHLADWVTDPAVTLPALRAFTREADHIGQPFLGRYTVWESSGSSGEPGLFVQDSRAMAVYDALEGLRRPETTTWQRLLDPWLMSERIAFVGATSGHFASTVSVERLRRLNPWYAERVHGVSFLQDTASMLAEIEALAPTIIATYPTAAALLAIERQAGRTRIAPRQIWTGGETLTPAVRRFIERAFGCRVINSYGASEFLAMASECSHRRLHLNADWLILEPVDEQGRPVAAGESSASCWLTNLANHVQPLIRYDLGDRVRMPGGRCRCGSLLPVIEVEGRCDDVLTLQAARHRPVTVLPLAVSTVLEDVAGLFDFQLRQTGGDRLLLTTRASGEGAVAGLERGREALLEWFTRIDAGPIQIRCRAGVPGRRGRSGKVPRVWAASAAS